MDDAVTTTTTTTPQQPYLNDLLLSNCNWAPVIATESSTVGNCYVLYLETVINDAVVHRWTDSPLMRL